MRYTDNHAYAFPFDKRRTAVFLAGQIVDTQSAVIAFSQSEKIKACILMANQCIAAHSTMAAPKQAGAQVVILTIIDMIANEIVLARRITGDRAWLEIEKAVSMAAVMARSGVVSEAAYHFTHALTQVTSLGQRAMDTLKHQKMI